jgi:LysM domain
MRRIIFALFISLCGSTVTATTPTKPLELAPGAPDRHVVVPGDTLSGLAMKFLREPHRWGELWKMNKDEIKNPHLIYPGQVLSLDRSGSSPSLSMSTIKLVPREYIEQFKAGIPSIPPAVIEPFLTEPLVMENGTMEGLARVVALSDGRVIAGAGDQLFTTPVTANAKLWQIFRPATPLIDPTTKEVLGYEATLLGTAKLVKTGELSEFHILSSKMEITTGNRLLPAPRADVPSYLPRAPEKAMSGTVIGIPGGLRYAGTNSVVTINLGKKDGIEHGHVLATELAGSKIQDREGQARNQTITNYQLPDSENGTIFVFRVFDRVSYALVMQAGRAVNLGDKVRTP